MKQSPLIASITLHALAVNNKHRHHLRLEIGRPRLPRGLNARHLMSLWVGRGPLLFWRRCCSVNATARTASRRIIRDKTSIMR